MTYSDKLMKFYGMKKENPLHTEKILLPDRINWKRI